MNEAEGEATTFFFAGLLGEIAFKQSSRASIGIGFPPESRRVRILIWNPKANKFFDGGKFEADRDNAYVFKNAREAIEMIRAMSWFNMEILLAYENQEMDMRVNGECFVAPPEMLAKAEEIKQARLRQRLKRWV